MKYRTPNKEQLESISCKFLMNLPLSERGIDRIWFHLQKCYFYYLDEIVHENPTYANNQIEDKQLLEFLKILKPYFPHYINFQPDNISQAISSAYYNIPVCGGIILNNQITKVLLVQSYRPEGLFGLPKGKINQQEQWQQCASREVFQQVGVLINFKQSFKIQINHSKLYIFYLSKIDQNQIQFKESTKEIKSYRWVELKKGIPKDVHLNLSTRKTFEQASTIINRQKKYYDNVMKKVKEEQQRLRNLKFQGYDKQHLRNILH